MHLLASDGRLYRCDVTPGLSNGCLATTDDAVSDDDWEEREANRTHSVKFTDPQEQDNREVSSTSTTTSTTTPSTSCSTWFWLLGCINRTIQPSDSYYMLNTIQEFDDDDDY